MTNRITRAALDVAYVLAGLLGLGYLAACAIEGRWL